MNNIENEKWLTRRYIKQYQRKNKKKSFANNLLSSLDKDIKFLNLFKYYDGTKQ